MAYIESDIALPAHHKTVRAARILGCRRSEIVGSLHCLWAWALTNAQDGDLSGFDPEEIADASDWSGDARAFLKALQECGKRQVNGSHGPGFLEIDKSGRLVIHHWYDHGGGKLIEVRQTDAYQKWLKRNHLPDTEENFEAWKAGSRTRRKPASASSDNVRRMSVGCPSDVAGCLDIDQPNLTKRSVAERRPADPRAQGALAGTDPAAAAGGVDGSDLAGCADDLPPERLLQRFQAEHPEWQSRLASALSSATGPVRSQAAYLAPLIKRILRGEEPIPIEPAASPPQVDGAGGRKSGGRVDAETAERNISRTLAEIAADPHGL